MCENSSLCWKVERIVKRIMKRRRPSHCCIVILVIVIVLTGSIALWVAFHFSKSDLDQTHTGMSVINTLEYFNVTDPMKIIWYHGTNTKNQVAEALKHNYMMLEADVLLRYNTLIPVMAHPPASDGELTLDEWLDLVLPISGKGIKLDFKNLEVISPSLNILKQRKNEVKCPVWVNAGTAIGPGTNKTAIDPVRFFKFIDDIYPEVKISTGWTTGCCQDAFTHTMMESMWHIIKDFKQNVSVSARASLLRRSWKEFKWLTDKSPRISITVWNPFGQSELENGITVYDLLFVKNNLRNVIYFDLPKSDFAEFSSLASTAGSPLNHFPIAKRDGLLITWYHAANNKKEMNKALNGRVMMLEADVILRGQNTSSETDIPVMAHPPLTDSDNTLLDWLKAVSSTGKGIKLDFKSTKVLAPALKVLRSMKGKLSQPIWLNADVIRGTNTIKTGVDADEFKKAVLQYFPEATLSVGWVINWSTVPLHEAYTEAMVDAMLTFCGNISQPITFPIEAAALMAAWVQLKRILDTSYAYTLTLWTNKAHSVDINDLLFVRKQTQYTDRIFYDLPNFLITQLQKL